MGKSKSDKPSKGTKREHAEDVPSRSETKAPPAKKMKLLDDTDDEGDDDEGIDVSLKIDEEYARRFEYNEKRKEKHRLEEKYGKEEDDSDSEAGVEEDDGGELVTEELDQEISATLNALRNKDPRIYDSKVKFFHDVDGEAEPSTNGAPKEKSMTLKEYHTKNLLEGKFGEDEEDAPPHTYAQEQEEARQKLLQEAHAASEDEDEDDFLVAKSRSEPEPEKKEKRVKITAADIENADKDPENFLSNYMASRAWVPKGDSRFAPLESDDEDEEAAAEEYEASYNMYFEDTAGANEKLVTYARDAIAKTTVRRDAQSARAKAREAARAKREAERRQREEDLARLRKLKVDEMEQKVNKIREIGGLKGREFNVAEWKDVLEADWSDDQWDREMQKRFGDSYYNDAAEAESDEDEGKGKKHKKPKKPKFDDDIDIKDLIPDFKDDEERPAITLTDDEEDEAAAEGNEEEEEEEEEEDSTKKKSSKALKAARAEAKSAARRDRRLIENLVDENLKYEKALAATTAPKDIKTASKFRYRETSPTSFGMTARDILLASDKQLNEFAGLKKLATFRDPAKKKKDKKHLSKKARLRQWRQETFGDAEGPKGGFEVLIGEEDGDVQMKDAGTPENGVNIKEGGGKKRKRKNKGKAKTEA